MKIIKLYFIPFFIFIIINCYALKVKTINIADINNDIVFVQGMKGCENLYLSKKNTDIFLSDLTGNIYLIKGSSYKELKVIKVLKINDYALGISMGGDGYLYAASASTDWLKKGGGVCKINANLNNHEQITKNFPGINGLAIDNKNNIYFVSGNMNFLNPKGAIYIMKPLDNGGYHEPEIFIDGLKSPNGLFFNEKDNVLIFTEVFHGVKSINIADKKIKLVHGKSRLVEGFDDVCIDSRGNCWTADQPNGFLKMYDPRTNMITRFLFSDFGVASSCRIRFENGKEFIFVTEFKQDKRSNKIDGRGIVIIPIDLLIRQKIETAN